MSTFIYYSFLIVGTLMLIRFFWDAVKWAFKVWYRIFSFLIIGILFIFVVVPLLFNLLFEFLLH